MRPGYVADTRKSLFVCLIPITHLLSEAGLADLLQNLVNSLLGSDTLQHCSLERH